MKENRDRPWKISPSDSSKEKKPVSKSRSMGVPILRTSVAKSRFTDTPRLRTFECEVDLDDWVTSKEKPDTPEAREVIEGLKAYREIKRERDRNLAFLDLLKRELGESKEDRGISMFCCPFCKEGEGGYSFRVQNVYGMWRCTDCGRTGSATTFMYDYYKIDMGKAETLLNWGCDRKGW
ncbi:hypothetical protein Goe24_01470 [Bacillus phage vB_BsuM-Goe24]|uniref:DNA primase n=1 Tax=Bacillus phage vB_BsuM-Goe3 TaxID=1933063 RepID=A0A1Z1DF58_BPGO3|nr:DNA primase [Bacillus phage vB_BsuM-Goe3]APZ82606.1 DNA primase [Bacillus phage vB_BsuM-Goe3]QDP43172.1 putative DNA primase [Bacillus phage vB_BveM-Goe7]WCS69522.1 hypothetical protein Goe24_01470 [Bacillus phage vB_BsuM-Goe24]